MVEAINSKSISVDLYGSKNSNSIKKADINDKSFMDYIKKQYNDYQNAKAKAVDQNMTTNSESDKKDYSELLSKLKDDISTLKDDYELSNKASSIADKAAVTKKINDDLKKLDNTLNKVEDVVKKDDSMSKTDLNEVKKLVNDIPKAALKKSSIKDKKTDISDYISSITNSDKSTVNMAEEAVNDSVNSIDTEKDKIDDSSNDIKEDTMTCEQMLQALQNILDALKNSDNIDADSLSDMKAQIEQLSDMINNSNLNIEDLQKASKDIDEILQMLEPVQENNDISKITDVLKELKSDINEKIESTVTQKSEVISELQNANAKDDKTDIHKFSQSSREEARDDNDDVNVSDTNSETANSNSNSNSSNNTSNSEESILNSIINGNNNNNMINRFQTLDSFEATLDNANIQEPEISEGSMAQDIVSSIRYMNVKGIEELTVKLNPRELGQVVINIVREGDAMKAQIKASSRETYELLMKNSEDLKKYLGEQNLKVQDVEIKFTNDTSYSRNDSFLGESDKNNNSDRRSNESHDEVHNESFDDSDEEDEDDLLSNINMLV